MTEYGVHHAYTRANYKNDIKAVIQKFYPSILVTTDWDNHMDHLALSLMVDEVLGELLREDTSYHPLVLKAQAYNGKWEGHPDYYSENNVTELVNEADGTDHIHWINGKRGFVFLYRINVKQLYLRKIFYIRLQKSTVPKV